MRLREVLLGDIEPQTIVVADYDPTWPKRFRREEARIRAALGETALRIEHIGSTSVPGLAAKPIVSPAGVAAALAAGMDVITVTTELTRQKFRDTSLLDRSRVVDDPRTLPAVVR